MKRHISKIAAIAAVVLFTGAVANAQEKTVMVGGAAMFPSKNIVENAINSKDHTTLVAAVKAAGLVETLQSDGPFTVFAPVNEAFNKLPAGTVDNLLKPENKSMLSSVLTYHVVAGRWSSEQIMEQIKMNHGSFTAATVAGSKLQFSMKDKNLVITDEKENKAIITITDVYQKNGVIHVIDTVLMSE